MHLMMTESSLSKAALDAALARSLDNDAAPAEPLDHHPAATTTTKICVDTPQYVAAAAKPSSVAPCVATAADHAGSGGSNGTHVPLPPVPPLTDSPTAESPSGGRMASPSALQFRFQVDRLTPIKKVSHPLGLPPLIKKVGGVGGGAESAAAAAGATKRKSPMSGSASPVKGLGAALLPRPPSAKKLKIDGSQFTIGGGGGGGRDGITPKASAFSPAQEQQAYRNSEIASPSAATNTTATVKTTPKPNEQQQQQQKTHSVPLALGLPLSRRSSLPSRPPRTTTITRPPLAVPSWVQTASAAPEVNISLLVAGARCYPGVSQSLWEAGTAEWELPSSEKSIKKSSNNAHPGVSTAGAAVFHGSGGGGNGCNGSRREEGGAKKLQGWVALHLAATSAPSRRFAECESVGEAIALGQMKHRQLQKRSGVINPALASHTALVDAPPSLLRQNFGISEFAARLSAAATGVQPRALLGQTVKERTLRVIRPDTVDSSGGAGASVEGGKKEKEREKEKERKRRGNPFLVGKELARRAPPFVHQEEEEEEGGNVNGGSGGDAGKSAEKKNAAADGVQRGIDKDSSAVENLDGGGGFDHIKLRQSVSMATATAASDGLGTSRKDESSAMPPPPPPQLALPLHQKANNNNSEINHDGQPQQEEPHQQQLQHQSQQKQEQQTEEEGEKSERGAVVNPLPPVVFALLSKGMPFFSQGVCVRNGTFCGSGLDEEAWGAVWDRWQTKQ